MSTTITRLAATAAVALLACAGLAEANAAGPAKVKVTIQGRNGDFSGTLQSSRRSCINNRTVTVYKQRGNHQSPGSDQRIGSDTSEVHNGKGRWETGNSGYKSGRFYARVGGKPGCRSASSPTITEHLVD